MIAAHLAVMMVSCSCTQPAESWTDRESVTPRAHVHDHVFATLVSGTHSVARVHGKSSFSHRVEAGVPQGDLGGRVCRNGDVEYKPLTLESPRGLQRPISGFERRARTGQTRPEARCDAGPPVPRPGRIDIDTA